MAIFNSYVKLPEGIIWKLIKKKFINPSNFGPKTWGDLKPSCQEKGETYKNAWEKLDSTRENIV